MAHFEDLDLNIQTIFDKIYNNQNLCKLLFYDDDNPSVMPDIVSPSILYTNIEKQKLFPYGFTPDLTDEYKSTLSVVFSDFRTGRDNILFKPGKVSFIICVHTYLWQLNLGDSKIHLRPNAILHELDKTFNWQRTLGLGKNIMDYAKPIQFNKNFHGYVYCINWVDFT